MQNRQIQFKIGYFSTLFHFSLKWPKWGSISPRNENERDSFKKTGYAEPP